MKISLIFFLLLNSYVISCQKLNAQSYRTKIAGVVLDSLTGENIKGATVSIKSDKDSFQTATNDKGNFAFEIEKAEKYLITVSCIGFFQFQKSFSLDNDIHDLVIVLKDSIIELAEFKIKAKKVLFEPGKITFLTDTLDLKTASSAFDLLKKTPVLTVSNDNVKIKGRIDAEIYLDGSPLTNIRILENLSAKKILKIEILSNPNSANDIEGKKGMVYITTKKVQEGYFGSLTGQLATSKKRDDSFSGFFSTKGVKMEFNLNVGWNYYKRPFESGSRWLRRINEESFSQSELAINTGLNSFFVPGINYSIDSLTKISFKGTFGISDYNNKITTNYYFPNLVSDDSLGVIRTGNEKWLRYSVTNNISFKRRKVGSKDNFSVYVRTNSYNTKKDYVSTPFFRQFLLESFYF